MAFESRTRSTFRYPWVLLFPVLIGVLTVGCSTTPSHPSSGSVPSTSVAPSSRATYTAAPSVGDLKQYEALQATIETEKGNFFISFYPRDAPRTVASFVKLARDGYFDGLIFHRVEPNFVVQGGDPTGTGTGGPGYTLPAEFNAHKNVRGAVAMARTADPDSAGSQFYVCLSAAPHLDNKYTVFGQVTKGMDNIDKIRVGDHMLKVRIEPKK